METYVVKTSSLYSAGCQDLESFGSQWKLFSSVYSINKHLNDKLIQLHNFWQPVETVLQYG